MKERKWMVVFLLIMINIVNASKNIDFQEKKQAIKQVLEKHKMNKINDILTIIMQYVSGVAVPNLRELSHYNDHLQFILTSDDQSFVYASYGTGIHQWDSMTGQLLHTIDTGAQIYGGAISRDNNFLFTYDYTPMIKIWDIEKGTLTKTLSPYIEKNIDSVKIFNHKNQLAIRYNKGPLIIWDLPSDQEIKRLDDVFVYSKNDDKPYCVSPDSRWIVYWSSMINDICIYDFQKSKSTHFGNKYVGFFVRRFDISTDGQYFLAMGCDNSCQIYKLNESTWIEHEILENINYVNYVFFTSNYIVSISKNSYEAWSLGTYEHHHQQLTKSKYEYLDDIYYICLLKQGFLLFDKFLPLCTLKISVNPDYSYIEFAEKSKKKSIFETLFKKIMICNKKANQPLKKKIHTNQNFF